MALWCSGIQCIIIIYEQVAGSSPRVCITILLNLLTYISLSPFPNWEIIGCRVIDGTDAIA